MSWMRSLLVVLGATTLFAVAACSEDAAAAGDDTSGDDDDSKTKADSGTTPTAEGGVQEETAILVDIGPEGGIITFRQLTLKVPAGALDEVLTIQMEVLLREVPAGVTPRGELYRLTPPTPFKKGATLTFRPLEDVEAPVVYWSRGDGNAFAPIQTTRSPIGPRDFEIVVPVLGDGFLGLPLSSDCTEGKTACAAAACKDLLTDPQNCGQCGFVCSAGSCLDGHCKSDGDAEKTCVSNLKNRWCPVLGIATDCPDVTTNRENCGNCGHACTAGTCQGGSCSE